VLDCDETQFKSAPIKVAMKGTLKLPHTVYSKWGTQRSAGFTPMLLHGRLHSKHHNNCSSNRERL
jgi:hypothetical protein